MLSLLPTSAPADTTAAYTLLAVIADPKLTKQRLDQLVDEAQKLATALADVQKASAEFEEQKAAVEAALAKRETAISAREQAVDKAIATAAQAGAERDKRLNAQEEAQAAERKRLDVVASDLAMRYNDVSEREKAVKALDADLAGREIAARNLADEASKTQANYQAKLNALKALTSAS